MTIKVSEVGKEFNYATFFDLTANTQLTLRFKSPSGQILELQKPRVSAPNVEVTDPDIGTIPAGTYMQITTEATDFTEAGEWCVCGIYEDVTPRTYYGDSAKFTVEEACSCL